RFLLTSIILTLSGLILFLVNTISGKITVAFFQGRKYFLEILWIGVVGTSIPVSMVYYGLSLSPISNTFLLQTEVIYSMILSRLLLKERINGWQILLSVSAFLGVFLITTEGTLKEISVGDILFLLAPFFFQCGHVVAKNLMKIVDPIVTVMFRLLIGGLAPLPILILSGLNLLEDVRDIATGSGIMIAGVSVSYAIGNSFWYYSVKNINLSRATAIIITYPLISMVLSILTLKEGLSPIKLLGITVTFSSILGLSLLRGKSEVAPRNKGYGTKNA
ncbi:MAG: DMT family transporter, partial [Candidatus Bathyarchaeia archaeon]